MTEYADPTDLDAQPVPEDSHCPACGADATDESVVEHSLSDMGYMHDDQKLECSECGHEWVNGVPIGEFDRPDMADDMECDSCGGWHLVHRAQYRGSEIELHLKCPNCNLFDRVRRELDGDGRALVGYPHITGQTEGAEPYGWVEDDEDGV